ncbi:MAG: hypothetical protein NTZ16_15035 [Verrucomicrobia bacterium]|nr:hypothetical protein [Verrucomicrobiota bacterium]
MSLVSVGSSGQGAAITTDATHINYVPVNGNSDTFTYTAIDNRGGSVVTANINVNVVTMTGLPGSITYIGNQAALSFFGLPGSAYNVERSTNGMSTWQVISNLTAATGTNAGVMTMTDDVSTLDPVPSSAYYRLQSQ